jgi:hypothetical protein
MNDLIAGCQKPCYQEDLRFALGEDSIGKLMQAHREGRKVMLNRVNFTLPQETALCPCLSETGGDQIKFSSSA